jgi:hypothetical protein
MDGNPELTIMDANRDGKADVLIIDTDSDGEAEGIAVDLDGDGQADIALVDSDGDGHIDSLSIGQETPEDANDLTEAETEATAEESPVPLTEVPAESDVTPPGAFSTTELPGPEASSPLDGMGASPSSIPAGGAYPTDALATTADGQPEEEPEDQEMAEDDLSGDNDEGGSEHTGLQETAGEAQENTDAAQVGVDTAQGEAAAVESVAASQESAAVSSDTAAAETPADPGTYEHVIYEARGHDYVDTAWVDRDGDGWHEESMSVTTGDADSDGAHDTAYADLDRDGYQEAVGRDTDRDGVMSEMITDGSGEMKSGTLHSSESRTVDENLKEISGENESDTHSGWNDRTETVDRDTSVHYGSDGKITVDVDGEETEVSTLDDATRHFGKEGDAKTENLGLDHDGDASEHLVVDTDDGDAGYDAQDDAGAAYDSSGSDSAAAYDAGAGSGYDSSAAADTSSSDDSPAE